MKLYKLIACLVCVFGVILLSSTNILPAQSDTAVQEQPQEDDPLTEMVLEAAAICFEIFQNAESETTFNVVLSDETIEEMVHAVGDLGFAVIDQDGSMDMLNPESMLAYGKAIADGTAYEMQPVYFTIYRDGHIGAAQFNGTQLRSLAADFTKTPTIYIDIFTDLKSISFTDKGWLIYERDLSSQNNTKAFNVDPHTMVRVTPLSDDLRTLCKTYITPVGYSENNLFTADWSERDAQHLDFASLYAMLFGLSHDGETLTWYSAKKYYAQVPDSDLFLIPQGEFEQTIQTYLNVPTQVIRSIPEYNASAQTYYFLGWQTGYYSVVPRLPTPEVIEARTNADGTITMITDAVFSWYGTDRAFRHEITVRPYADGTFQYVENKLLPNEENILYDCLLPSQREAALKNIQ